MVVRISRGNSTFAALRVRNFRLYFSAQAVSVSGRWMQAVAQTWLVLDLTGSGTAVGTVTALQFAPLLLGAPFGGVIADRVNKRHLLMVTQSIFGLGAATLGMLVLTDRVELWMIYGLALTLGVVGAVSNPTRQTFVTEMVGHDRLVSALGLNSVLINTARIIGPAIAGWLIITSGIALCFLLNAASSIAPLIALALMRTADLHPAKPQPRKSGQLKEGFAYAVATPHVRIPLLMTMAVGLFSFHLEVTLPLLARFTFEGDADTYGLMLTAMGVGAVVGGLYTASQPDRPKRAQANTLATWGIGAAVLTVAPNLFVALAALAVIGGAGTSFLAISNSVLQLESPPEMRGRIIALRAVAFPGMRPIGSPLIGAIGEHAGARYALGLGATVALIAAAAARRALVGLEN